MHFAGPADEGGKRDEGEPGVTVESEDAPGESGPTNEGTVNEGESEAMVESGSVPGESRPADAGAEGGVCGMVGGVHVSLGYKWAISAFSWLFLVKNAILTGFALLIISFEA